MCSEPANHLASPRTWSHKRGGEPKAGGCPPLAPPARWRKTRRMLREPSPPRTADCMGERHGSRRGPRTAARVAPTKRRQHNGICNGRVRSH
eukprot:4082362-Alexandrium_andersonii.AAC.1